MGLFPFLGARKRPLRLIGIILKCAFIITLPLTAIAIIGGTINGTLISFWLPEQVKLNSIAFSTDFAAILQDWGVPSFTFREFQNTKNDFRLRRLNTNDWVGRLGFIHPEQYAWSLEADKMMAGLDTLGDIPSLMYDENSSCEAPPKEQWVYISNVAWPDLYKWDGAFRQAIEVGYAKGRINSTRLFFVECLGTGKFLCGVWNVKAPSLLHFSYEDDFVNPEDIQPGLTYRAGVKGLRKVITRVIEFPLTDAYTSLPSTAFSSEREQLLSIMKGDRLYEQFEPYDSQSQEFNRILDYLEIVWNRKGTTLNQLYKVDDWFTKNVFKSLHLEDIYSSIHVCTAFITYTIITIILKPWFFFTHYFWEFLGVDEFAPEHNPWDYFMKQMNPWRLGFWGNLFDEFWKNVTIREEAENQRLYKESGTTKASLPQRTEVLESGKRYWA